MRIASYNIKCFNYNADKEDILEVLRTVDADVVGIQEVDCDTERCGPGNQIQMIAEALGYPYWYFAASIAYKGGQYGHGVVSRYPIVESSNVDYLEKGEKDHNRTYERHVLDVNGKKLVFYNTHITLGKEQQGSELRQVTAAMAEDEYCVLTGDMNALPETLMPHIDQTRFAMLNPGIPTYPQGEGSTRAIDHILVGRHLKHSEQITVFRADCSDHNLIYTYINFK